MPTTESHLLSLPPELRFQIYHPLLTSPLPLKGPFARHHDSETYNIHTAILRTCKRIHHEARHVFFGRNTFQINSLPSPQTETDEGSGAFEPPLQLKDLGLVRSLEVDLVYWPNVPRTKVGLDGMGWQPVCRAAERYVASLGFVLEAVKDGLVELKIGGNVRPYVDARVVESGDGKENGNEAAVDVDVRRLLMGFHVADTNPRFRNALANMKVQEYDMRFDFPDSHFEFRIERDVLLKGSLVHLVGQVLIVRSEVRMKAVLEELGNTEDEQRMTEKV
ncbi:hypothetical protein EK21DRAFT_68511 [Setomelanomma holmii]|uniref:Uncharacterized protein n=1 Tax=Setomelanomma holmii TaxID=210430 RepID=A0A9P4H7H1_9PLEO|nr:hypothetical protein EK21DRAFT_68511 [Setomelanomma holmii]